MSSNRMIFDVIINIVLDYLVNYLLFLVLVCLLHQTLSVCRSHHVSLESRRLNIDLVSLFNDTIDLAWKYTRSVLKGRRIGNSSRRRWRGSQSLFISCWENRAINWIYFGFLHLFRPIYWSFELFGKSLPHLEMSIFICCQLLLKVILMLLILMHIEKLMIETILDGFLAQAVPL